MIKRQFYNPIELKGETIDRALKIVGLAFTVVLGLLAFLRGWHFNAVKPSVATPELRRPNKRITSSRSGIGSYPLCIAQPTGRRIASAEARTFPCGRVLLLPRPRFQSCQATARLRTRARWRHQGSGRKLGVSKSQRITAHLLVASKLIAEARSLPSGSSVLASKCGAARSELRVARELDASDLDVLELEAKLARLLNTKQPLQKAVDEMERAAQKNPIRYARALGFQAELLEVRSTKGALNTARIKLETASRALDDADVGAEKTLELALICEQLAALHLRRGTATLWRHIWSRRRSSSTSCRPPKKLRGLSVLGC